MKGSLRIVWFDDDKKKYDDFKPALEAAADDFGVRASAEFFEVSDDLLSKLPTWLGEAKRKPPSILLIDHVFSRAPTLPFDMRGSSVAHLLRRVLPNTPMVCVTAMFDETPEDFDQEDISEYSALFTYQTLSSHLEDIFSIAIDFHKLRAESALRDHVLKILRPPKLERDTILSILPEEFQNPQTTTTQHRVAYWIFNYFLQRPGFVYDELHVATLLGLSPVGFRKVRPLFEKALYAGVFSRPHEPLWWVGEVHRILFSDLAHHHNAVTPQYAGRSLPGITQEDFSVCYVSGESSPPPDTVAKTDTTRTATLCVVRQDFVMLPVGFNGITPGFEPRLVLRPNGVQDVP